MMIRSGNYNEIHISGKTPHDLLVGNWKYQAYQSGWFRYMRFAKVSLTVPN